MSEYRNLKKGELINIGDQYQSGESWVTISENEYRKHAAGASIFDPFIMPRMRRANDVDPSQVEASEAIRAELASEVVVTAMSDYRKKEKTQ